MLKRHTFEDNEGTTRTVLSTDDADGFAKYLNDMPESARKAHEAHGNEDMLHGCKRVIHTEAV